MFTHIFNKKQKLVFLIILSLGITLTYLGLPHFSSPFLNNSYEEGNIVDFDDQDIPPKTAEYQNFNGVGQNLDIVIHQSLINSSTIEFLNLDNSNSFKEAFPNFSGYNTSFVNITIEGLYAPNKTLDLEKDIDDVPISFGTPTTYAFSFDAPSKCNLTEFQICLSGSSGAANGGVGFQIWNATWTGSVIDPDQNTGLFSTTETVYTTDTKVWHKISPNVQLDPKNTDNGTFFIVMWNTNLPTSFPQFNAKNDGAGQYESLVRFMPVASWVSQAYEVSSNVSLVLADNTPKPTDIGLTVNDTAVTADISGENFGYWTSEEEVASTSDKLNFTISADWWEVSCNVTNTQINYTKSDLNGNANFNIINSGDIVQWNVSIPEGLNYFDSSVPDFNTINFTIPSNWLANTISVFNGTTEIQASDINKRLLGGGFREIQILNAGNGSNWFLIANSTNLLSSIDTYVSGIALNNVNHSNIVDFNATFSEIIRNGDLNLSVYSPNPQYLNHSKILDISILSSSDEFLVSSWDLSLNVNQYGIFKIQTTWSNETAAGFLETYLTVIADTDLNLGLPKTTFDSGDIFNMTVFYNDTGQDFGIEADAISYQIGSGSIRTTENITYIGNGYYNITFSCIDTDFNYGLNTIVVNTTKQYYNNQSESVSITILGETEATILYPPNNAVFDSGDTFDLTIFYNDTVKDLGIAGATINYSLDGGATYRQDNVNYIGQGVYNITISASDLDFNGYGVKSIDVNINMDYHYNQSKSVTIKLLGETTPLTAV